MVVRVARQAQRSAAQRCVVAADDVRIVQACEAHGVSAILTRGDHVSGSDRLAEACTLLGLADDERGGQRAGRRAPDRARAHQCGGAGTARPARLRHEHGSTCHRRAGRLSQPQRGQGGARPAADRLVFQPRAHSLVARRHGTRASRHALPSPRPLRHVGVYGYRAGFLRRFPGLEPAPLETTGVAGAAAGAVAWRTHCGAPERGRTRRGCRHAARPGAGPPSCCRKAERIPCGAGLSGPGRCKPGARMCMLSSTGRPGPAPRAAARDKRPSH